MFSIAEEVLLTTIDNPFNPFTNYDEWLAYDLEMGYCTNALVDRIANVSDELSDADYDSVVEEAMREICEINALGIYRLITESEIINPNTIETNLAYKLNQQLQSQ